MFDTGKARHVTIYQQFPLPIALHRERNGIGEGEMMQLVNDIIKLITTGFTPATPVTSVTPTLPRTSKKKKSTPNLCMDGVVVQLKRSRVITIAVVPIGMSNWIDVTVPNTCLFPSIFELFNIALRRDGFEGPQA